jgi:hypothetical protein
MPLAASALLLLALLWALPAAAFGAEPARPFFVDLGIETVSGRQNGVAVPLADGRVLVAGGADDVALRSAEIFDPVAIEFESVPNLTRYKRTDAVGARLPDGKVLIAGGTNNVPYAHAEVFDPATEKFSDVAGEMTTPRNGAIAASLPDGRILIAGGWTEGEALESAEVFDPVEETFTGVAAAMRSGHGSAVGGTLPDGRVLIAAAGTGSEAVTEIFDPRTGTFELINAGSNNDLGSAAGVILPSGQMLITGGISGGMSRRWAGMVDPASGAFGYLPKEGGTQTATERWGAMAAPLPGGLALITGGSWPDARSSAEIFVSAPALSADGVALGGADAADFSVLSDSCTGAELDFEESCALSVRFIPARLGAATASLSFDDNEPVPTTVPLTATGVAPVPPATDPPAGPPIGPSAPPRAFSVRCGAKPIARAPRVQVTCRINPPPGAWEARLQHGGKTLAHRNLSGGRRKLTFRPLRSRRGGFRLELVPLPRSV